MPMHYEVEVKYPLPDVPDFRERLKKLGAEHQETIEQEDLYFGHPQRDFAQTDEALRIRRTGSQNVVTYKGPLVDAETKTRQEIEVGLESGKAGFDKFRQVLTQLGFQGVFSVGKVREKFSYRDRDLDYEIVIDTVRDLGTYAEIESLADENAVETVRTQLLELASRLNLGPEVERRSYLRLLLDQQDNE